MIKKYCHDLFRNLFVFTIILFCATGCQEKQKSWTPGTPLAKDQLRVAVLYLDKASDSGYSLAHDTGIEMMRTTLGLREDQIIRKTNISESDPMVIDNAIRESVAAGARIIIATSWSYMDACEKFAGEFPNVVFAHASGYKYNDSNFTNYFGKLYQARYLSGIIAGMKSKTGKIGFVAAKGLENSEVTSGVNAFALGVESVNPKAGVYVYVTNNWYDPAGERRAAKQLIEAGCDVIAQHCDTPSPQAEAADSGVWGIGYNSDMKEHAPEAVLTSVVWHWGVYYTYLAKSVMDGSFTTTPYFGGLVDGIVGLTPLTPLLTNQAMKDTVQRAEKQIKNGSLHIFSGVLITNDGQAVGTPGKVFTNEEITRSMNWYYRTVTVR